MRPTTPAAENFREENLLNEIQTNPSFPSPPPRARIDQQKAQDVEGYSELKKAAASVLTTGMDLADDAVEDLANAENIISKDVQMEDVHTREMIPNKEDEGIIERIDQRREEEEEEPNEEEETKEEEEEASQGQQEVALDEDLNEAVSAPKSINQVNVEMQSEPRTPVAETVTSEPEPAADEGHSSGSEERVVTTRRTIPLISGSANLTQVS